MKSNSGFTFAEVLLALVILATSAFILSDLQFRSYFRVSKYHAEIERIFLIKKALYKMLLTPEQTEKAITKKYTDPNLKIISHKKEIHKKSSLASFRKDIDILWSEGTWSQDDREASSKMITFALKYPEEEKKQ
jgi:prepilin-type N-terminal cleavage/methylation domain-containing protein